jgi:hypothetical protein
VACAEEQMNDFDLICHAGGCNQTEQISHSRYNSVLNLTILNDDLDWIIPGYPNYQPSSMANIAPYFNKFHIAL